MMIQDRMKITPYKGRTLDESKPVHVYRNLGNAAKERYSIRQGGLVVGHTDEITLADCKFKVSEAGRNKVLREGRKNVHAFVKGYMITKDEYEHEGDIHISYNPYRNDSFVVKEESIKKANQVFLGSRGESRANGVVTYDK